MKSIFLTLGALFALSCATSQAQLAITTNTLPPALGVDDQYYLPGPVDEATGAMTASGSDNTGSADNDGLTYLASGRESKGQSFTTGSNAAGYTISSVTVRHILWTNFLSNGTWMSVPAGSSFPFRFGTISGTTITSILTTNATYSGSALSMSGGSGTGIYFTFDLSSAGIGTLSPNTTYFFEIASASQYLELHNTRTNAASYTNGTAFYGDTGSVLDQSGTVNLPAYGGEFAFVAKLMAVGAPTVTAVASPAGAADGQSFTVTATVTPGNGTVTNVSADLSGIGGSPAAPLVLSGTANVYTNTFAVPATAAAGTATLAVTVKDTTPLSGTCGISFTVLPNAYVWNGGSAADSKWTTTNNWQGGFAPAFSGSSVVFAGTTRLTPDMNGSYSVAGLTISNTAGSFAISSSTGSTLTNGGNGIVNNSANPQTLNVPVVLAAAQTFSLASGSLTLNSNVTGNFDLVTAGAGAATFASTGTNVLGNLRLASGQLNLTAGTLNVSNSQGSLTRVESNATLVVSGGTLNILGNSALNGWFPIGVTAGATGAVVVAGGTINVNDHWGTEVGNESGAGMLTINSGTFINDDAGGIGLLVGETGSAGGTVNLNGGYLIVNKITANQGGNFYLNGGTLEPLASSSSFWANSGNLTAAMRNGGAVVNTAGYDITIAQTLNHSPVNGDNATDGGLTKTGNGALTLAGGYYYTGPNQVLGGTLNLNLAYGIPGTGGDLVVSNATLTVDASNGSTLPAANMVVKSGAVLSLTNNPFLIAINGTGGLTLTGGTTINLNYGALAANPSSTAIKVAGSFTAAGTNVINIVGSGFVAGEFPLITCTGASVPTNTFKLAALPAGVNAVLTNNTASSSLDLLVTFVGNTLSWHGAGADGSTLLTNWDINTSSNWYDASLNAVKYLQYNNNAFGDLVTFDDNGYNTDGTNHVGLNVRVVPSGVTVSGSTPYTLTGAGGIDGATPLVMNNSSSLLLGTSNNYTGGTYLNAGTLIVNNDAALGSATNLLTLGGGTLQLTGSVTNSRPVVMTAASTVDIVPGATAQWSGLITGGTNLTLTDNGTLILSPGGTNSLGDLRLSGGQFNVASGVVNVSDSQGSATRIENNATLVVSGGTLNITGGSSLNGWFPIGVNTGSTGMVVVAGGTINVNDHWGTEIGNEIGSGVLTINSGTFVNNDAGGIGLIFGDGSSPGGILNLNGGALIVNKIVAGAGSGGQFYFNGGTLKPTATISGFWVNSAKINAYVRNGGAVIDTAGYSETIAQPLLHSTVSGDNAMDGGLTKNGNGTLQLSGINAFTGPVVINGGTLTGVTTFAGALTNNAILAVNGTLTVNGNITLNAGSTNSFIVNGTAATNTVVLAGAKVNYGGLLGITTNGVFTKGQQFVLFSGAGATNTSRFAGIAGSPGSGLAFSFTNGVLSVVTAGPTASELLTNSCSNGVLTLSWPANEGWRLQVQTNTLSAGLGTNWIYLTDGTVGSTNITVDPGQPAVFYRLKYP